MKILEVPGFLEDIQSVPKNLKVPKNPRSRQFLFPSKINEFLSARLEKFFRRSRELAKDFSKVCAASVGKWNIKVNYQADKVAKVY